MVLSVRWGVCEKSGSFWGEKVKVGLKAVECVTEICAVSDIYSHLPRAESSSVTSCVPSVWGIQQGGYLEGSQD